MRCRSAGWSRPPARKSVTGFQALFGFTFDLKDEVPLGDHTAC
jgi:hypothetical protein